MQIVIERPAFTQELGEKSRFSVPNSLRIRSVNPTGMVDLITITACGLMAIIIADHRLDRAGIEVVSLGIVVGGVAIITKSAVS